MKNCVKPLKVITLIIAAAVFMTAAASPSAVNAATSRGDLPYFADILSETELSAYRAIRAAVTNCGQSITINTPLTSEMWDVLTEITDNQDPHCYNIKSVGIEQGESDFTLSFSYYYNKRSFDKAVLAANTAADKILAGIDADASETEKLHHIYESIRADTLYNEEAEYADNFYGVFRTNEAGQEGFAEAFSFLCTRAGIHNTIKRGEYTDGAYLIVNRVTLSSGMSYNICVPAENFFMKSDAVFEEVLALEG
jgi:hypothetical protein